MNLTRSTREAAADDRCAGDPLEEAFARHQDELLGTLYYLVGNVEDARDALQDAFIKCWKHRSEVDEIENLKAWIFRIALNTGRDLHRAEERLARRRQSLEDEPMAELKSTNCHAELEHQEELARVRQALKDLRPEEQEVFLLRQNGQLSYDEIATAAGIPLGTVKTRMRLALENCGSRSTPVKFATFKFATFRLASAVAATELNMQSRETLRQQMLELIYGLASDEEAAALRRQIDAEPETAALWAEVQQQARLLAEASRWHAPPLAWNKLNADTPAAASSTAMPAASAPAAPSPAATSPVAPVSAKSASRWHSANWMHWAVSLAAAVLLMISAGTYGFYELRLRSLAQRHVQLVVTGPSTLQSGASQQYQVRAQNVIGQPVSTDVDYSLATSDGQEIVRGKETTNAQGWLEVQVPANVPAGMVNFQVDTRGAYADASLGAAVPVLPPRTVTRLTLDRPVYQPGEKILGRSLTLDAYRLQPPADSSVYFQIQDEKGQPLPGSEFVSEASSGTATAELAAPSVPGKYKFIAQNTTTSAASAAQESAAEREIVVRSPITLPARPLAADLARARDEYKDVAGGVPAPAAPALPTAAPPLGSAGGAGGAMPRSNTIAGRAAKSAALPATDSLAPGGPVPTTASAAPPPVPLSKTGAPPFAAKGPAPAETAPLTGAPPMAAPTPAAAEPAVPGSVAASSPAAPPVVNPAPAASRPVPAQSMAQSVIPLQRAAKSQADSWGLAAAPAAATPHSAITFYPEGGALVAGLESRVYFAARDALGRPLDVAGRVVTAGGEVAARWRSTYAGRGRFDFTPRSQESYHVEIDEPAGATLAAVLPAAHPDRSLVLSTAADPFTTDGRLLARLRSSQPGIPCVVTVTCRGVQVGEQSATSTTAVGELIPVKLPAEADGVLRLAVYDQRQQPALLVAERLLFRPPVQKLALQLEGLAAAPAPGSTARVAVAVTDETRRPRAATLGVAVVSETPWQQSGELPSDSQFGFYATDQIAFFDYATAATLAASPARESAEQLDLILGTQGPSEGTSAPLGDVQLALQAGSIRTDGDRMAGGGAGGGGGFGAGFAGAGNAGGGITGGLAFAPVGSPPLRIDNLAEVAAEQSRELGEFQESRQQAFQRLGRISLFGGGVLFAVLVVMALRRSTAGVRFLAPTFAATAAAMIVGLVALRQEPAGPVQVAMVAPRGNTTSPRDEKDKKPEDLFARPSARAVGKLEDRPIDAETEQLREKSDQNLEKSARPQAKYFASDAKNNAAGQADGPAPKGQSSAMQRAAPTPSEAQTPMAPPVPTTPAAAPAPSGLPANKPADGAQSAGGASPGLGRLLTESRRAAEHELDAAKRVTNQLRGADKALEEARESAEFGAMKKQALAEPVGEQAQGAPSQSTPAQGNLSPGAQRQDSKTLNGPTLNGAARKLAAGEKPPANAVPAHEMPEPAKPGAAKLESVPPAKERLGIDEREANRSRLENQTREEGKAMQQRPRPPSQPALDALADRSSDELLRQAAAPATIYWQPQLQTDAAGRREIEFTLPTEPGRYILWIEAHTTDLESERGRLGFTRTEIVVQAK